MKYKFLGFFIIAFILLLLYIMLRPKDGIPYQMFRNFTIDSVIIKNYQRSFTVTNNTDLLIIKEYLQNAQEVDIEYGINVKTSLYFIDIYFKGNKKLERIRFVPKGIDDVVVQVNERFYEGKDFYSFLTRKLLP